MLVFLVNSNFTDFLLIFDIFSSEGNTDSLLILRDRHEENLYIRILGRNTPGLSQLKVMLVKDSDLSPFSHDVSVHRAKI